MTTPNDGGAAFPNIVHGAIAEYQVCEGGMSLRDYFAAKVMQSILSTPEMLIGVMKGNGSRDAAEVVSQAAYEQADSMLIQRAKGKA